MLTMTSNTSLELEALIRPVSALLLEVPDLLLRLTNIPRPDNPKKDTPPSPTEKDTPTDAPGLLLHPNNIPGIDKLQEDTPPSPLNTSTGNINTKVPTVIPLGEVENVKNNTSSQKAPQHPHSINKTPEHSTLPINTPEATHKNFKTHNTHSNTPDTSKKHTDTHTPESIESKLAKLHIVPLRKYSENAPPDNSLEQPRPENIASHAPLANNTPKNPALQTPEPTKEPEPPKSNTDSGNTDESHEDSNSAEESGHAPTLKNNPGGQTSKNLEPGKKHEPPKNKESPDSLELNPNKATNESEDTADTSPPTEEEGNNHETATKSAGTGTAESPRDAITQKDELGDPPPEVATSHAHNGDEF